MFCVFSGQFASLLWFSVNFFTGFRKSCNFFDKVLNHLPTDRHCYPLPAFRLCMQSYVEQGSLNERLLAA